MLDARQLRGCPEHHVESASIISIPPKMGERPVGVQMLFASWSLLDVGDARDIGLDGVKWSEIKLNLTLRILE